MNQKKSDKLRGVIAKYATMEGAESKTKQAERALISRRCYAYRAWGSLWAVSTLSMAIGGESLSMEALFLLMVCSIVSGIGAWYCYDRHVQDKAQHELNMKLRRTRR